MIKYANYEISTQITRSADRKHTLSVFRGAISSAPAYQTHLRPNTFIKKIYKYIKAPCLRKKTMFQLNPHYHQGSDLHNLLLSNKPTQQLAIRAVTTDANQALLWNVQYAVCTHPLQTLKSSTTCGDSTPETVYNK